MLDNEQEYIKPSAFARRLGVTRGAVYKWIREGKLGAVKFADNAVRIPRAEAERFVKEAEQAYTPEHTMSPGHAALPALA